MQVYKFNRKEKKTSNKLTLQLNKMEREEEKPIELDHNNEIKDSAFFNMPAEFQAEASKYIMDFSPGRKQNTWKTLYNAIMNGSFSKAIIMREYIKKINQEKEEQRIQAKKSRSPIRRNKSKLSNKNSSRPSSPSNRSRHTHLYTSDRYISQIENKTSESPHQREIKRINSIKDELQSLTNILKQNSIEDFKRLIDWRKQESAYKNSKCSDQIRLGSHNFIHYLEREPKQHKHKPVLVTRSLERTTNKKLTVSKFISKSK